MERVRHEVQAVQVFYKQLENLQSEKLLTATRLLADLPQIRAVLATHDRATIEDALNGFQPMSGADLLGGASEEGILYRITDSPQVNELVKKALSTLTPVTGYLTHQEYFLQAVAVPVILQEKTVGVLVTGFRLGSEILDRLRLMTRTELALVDTNHHVIQQTQGAKPLLEGATAADFGSEMVTTGTHLKTTFPLVGPLGENVGFVMVFRSLEDGLRVVAQLRQNILGISILFGLISILLVFVLARGIATPLRRLTEALSKMDPTEPETLSGIAATSRWVTDRDLAQVLESFSHLVSIMKVEQERTQDLIAERTQDLEREVAKFTEECAHLHSSNLQLQKALTSKKAAS